MKINRKALVVCLHFSCIACMIVELTCLSVGKSALPFLLYTFLLLFSNRGVISLIANCKFYREFQIASFLTFALVPV